MLRRLTPSRHADLLIGSDTGDDATVWRRPDGRALVATVDVFTPIVDDPHAWGEIAAVNAASDVYAMGGTPLFALNVVAWPRDHLPLEVLGAVLDGAATAATRGGWVIGGGHTVDGAEPLFGQAVIGEVDEEALLTNAGAAPGDHLVLTKPIGNGLVATAVKRSEPADLEPGGRWHAAYTAAVREMTRLNDVAARVAVQARVRAATDVTGFGLLGHLGRLAEASGVGAAIEADAVPQLPQGRALLAAGCIPGGTERNLAYLRPRITSDRDDDTLTVLADAQTSGGLLLCVPARERAEGIVAELAAGGHTAAIIGRTTDGPAGSLTVR